MSKYHSDPIFNFLLGAHNSDIELMRRLFDEDPDMLRKLREDNKWVVCDAGKFSSPEAIKLLIEFGADINEQDSNSCTGLCWAVTRARYDAVKTLLELGADRNLGCPIFDVVSAKNDDPIAMAKLLLDHGANVNEPFLVEGWPPRNILSRATEMEMSDLVEFLLSRGAEMPGGLPTGTPPGAAPTEEAGDYSKEILKHFRKHYGPLHNNAIQEIVPTSEYPIAIHYVLPTRKRKNAILFTVGMSRYTMSVPQGDEKYRLAELSLVLPANWPTPEEAIQKPEWAWPIQWMRQIAAYPHANNTWLGGPFTVMPNGDPPQPLGPGTLFAAWALAGPPTKGCVVKCRGGIRVQLYHLHPLYAEEYTLERREGMEVLGDRLSQIGVSDYFESNRPNAGLQR